MLCYLTGRPFYEGTFLGRVHKTSDCTLFIFENVIKPDWIPVVNGRTHDEFEGDRGNYIPVGLFWGGYRCLTSGKMHNSGRHAKNWSYIPLNQTEYIEIKTEYI